ncbi:unnamed protein product [Closterium sp. NIES-65]|nr:unnamed protein product [Closterium sp. NIES-65]
MTSRRPSAAARRDNTTIPESLSNKRLRSRELQQGDTNTEAAVAASVSAWGSRLPCVKDEPAPNDALTALLNAPSSTTFKTVSLYNHMGVGCQVNAHDALTLADKKYMGDAVADFHNMCPRCPNGKSWVVLDSKAYAYAKIHGKAIGRCTGPSVFEYDYIAVPVFAGLLHLMCKRDHPEVDQEASRQALIKAKTIIMELQRQDLRIPLQPVPVINDNGYICVDPPVDIRRELLDHKEKFAVIEHDIQVLTAKIEYLAIRKGVTTDELDTGARQHQGAVVDTLVPTATPRKHAKAEPTADGIGQKEVAQTPPTRALAAVPSISPCPAPHTPAVKDSQVTAGDATPAVVRQQQRDHLAEALRSRAKTPVPAAPGNPGRVASSGRTGAMWNAAKQRYYVRIISACRQQVRLGSYEDKDEASYAYAAGAVVLRPNSRISCTVELSDETREVPLQICSAKAVGAVDAEAACTPIVASAPQGEEDTEAVKERLIDELMEGKDEDDEEGNGGGQSSSNDPCGENGSEEEQTTKAPHSRKRIEAADGQVTREEFDALRDSQNDTAETLARLESHVLTIIRLGEGRKRKRASTSAATSLGREASKRKRQSDDDEESTCDEDELPAKVAWHAHHDKSPVLQTALDILPAEKAWKGHVRRSALGSVPERDIASPSQTMVRVRMSYGRSNYGRNSCVVP